jgi:hypothetical protein
MRDWRFSCFLFTSAGKQTNIFYLSSGGFMPVAAIKRPRLKAAAHSVRPAIHQKQIRQEIEERAKQIFLRRNGGAGDSLSDWLQAEKEITSKS